MKREERNEMIDHRGNEIEQCLKTIEFLSESTEDHLFLWDFQTGNLHFSNPVCEKYNLPKREEYVYQIQDLERCVYARDADAVKRTLRQVECGDMVSCNIECRLLNNHGEKVWISFRGKSRCSDTGKPELMLGRISDSVMSRKVDTLTGLLNMTCLFDDLEKELQSEKKGFLMLLGIDDFKNINIKQGRGYGNYILKIVTEIMEEVVDLSLSIYRVDGDRYAINMEGRTKGMVQTTYLLIQEKVLPYCTMSAGAVPYGEEILDGSGVLYQYAENALDRAKKRGKNNLVFFSADDYEKNLNRIDLQEELRESVRNGFAGFHLCYQLQVSGTDYHVHGAEALLRYESPSRGRISPEEFIPLLEQTELIDPVGDWVLATALHQCKCWRKWVPDFHISVNISYIQLRNEMITQKVLDALKKAELSGESLTLEVTESMQLQEYQYFNQIFYSWRRCGIQIAIDDFGTGYSSLGYLKSMEINEVKIDRCFVSRLQHSVYNCRLISNMIELSHSEQLRVCCEGVETEEELAVLRTLHPDLLQGYLFSKPYEAETFARHYIRGDSEEHSQWEAYRKRLYQLSGGEKTQEMPERACEQGNIIEEMDEIVFVCDQDSYELYYMNTAGQLLTGVHDYKGRKCYKVFQGRNDPCESCKNHKLNAERFLVWEKENTFLNRHFLLKDKLIPWNGKMAHMEIAIDVTEKEHVSKSIQEKLDFEQNIVECTRMLVEEPDTELAIRKVLRSIGAFYQADRSYIFERAATGDFWINTHEWCEKGVTSQQDELQNVPGSTIQRWVEAFQKGESVVIRNLEHIKKSALEEWEILHTQGIRRLVVAPIRKAQRVIGFLGVDNPKRHHGDAAQLHTMSCFLTERLHDTAAGKLVPEIACEEVLGTTNLGLWKIILNRKNRTAKMYGDRTMKRIMGVNEEQIPEEMYQYWNSRIGEQYRSYVAKSVERIVTSGGPAQLEYTWVHPELGECVVQCLGVRMGEIGDKVCLTGYHRLVSEMELLQFSTESKAEEKRALQENKWNFREKYIWKSVFYYAMLSETVAFAEVELDSGELRTAGGLWKSYMGECRENKEKFAALLERKAEEEVHPEDMESVQRFVQEEMCSSRHANGILTKKLCFRRCADDAYQWMKLTMHIFRERYTDRVYALLYLKNIDSEKRKELVLQKAANLDPLTGVYNRVTFEREVERYILRDNTVDGGALVILDLDDFKGINDRYGHAKGDEALKTLTGVLKMTFRHEDLIGRLGGDEFLVFIKNVEVREILNRRMNELFAMIHSASEIPLRCSVGITFVSKSRFSYERSLEEADQALYESKRLGKDRYCYYRDIKKGE